MIEHRRQAQRGRSAMSNSNGFVGMAENSVARPSWQEKPSVRKGLTDERRHRYRRNGKSSGNGDDGKDSDLPGP